MKNYFLVPALVFCSTVLFSQTFNGSIDFKYATQKDTTMNVYLVKDKIVKLDQYNKKSTEVQGSFIFDLNTSEIKYINPKRKVWGIHKSETPPIVKGQCVVTKGGNKKIQGISCTEYNVKNTDENTSITYWLATDKFTFFAPILKMWNRKDKQSIYFNKIEGLPEGSMPLLSEEKQISDGKILTRLEVTKIGRKMPDEAALQVPAGYNKFDQ
jgi:hypothetical protein